MTVADFSKFTPEQRAMTVTFVDFVADRIDRPGWEEALREALDTLAREAQAMWPADPGEEIELGVQHLGGRFNGLADDFEAVEFVMVTGYILLNGQDGPLATAVAMRDTIDALAHNNKGE